MYYTNDDDTEMPLEDQLRIITINNPTLVGDEIVTLAACMAATTEQEVRRARANACQRATVPS
jgi:hypothetical protein